ncbi:MAG: serine hydrolase [Planctomycetes bacterium]|nr:serine hydrolase [Planctomycetota bacterium]
MPEPSLSPLRRAVVVGGVVAATAAGIVAQTGTEPFPTARRLLHDLAIDRPRQAFLAIWVDRDGIAFLGTAGVARPDPEVPFTEATLVPLGLLTRVLLRAALDSAAAAGRFDWSAPIGAAVPGLPEALAGAGWGSVRPGVAGGPPQFVRFVCDGEVPRSLQDILAVHAFLPPAGVGGGAQPDSMLPPALLQRALEQASGATWSELLRRAARELGAHSVRAADPELEALSIARFDRSGAPLARWRAEVPAAGGAAGTARDVAALLCGLAGASAAQRVESLADPFHEWAESEVAGRAVLELELGVPGVTGVALLYREGGAMAFAFTNRALATEVAELHRALRRDRFGEAVEDETWQEEELVEEEPGEPAVADVVHYGGALPVELGGSPVQIDVAGAELRLRTADPQVLDASCWRAGDRIGGQVRLLGREGELRRVWFELVATCDAAFDGVVLRHRYLHAAGRVEHMVFRFAVRELPAGAELLPLVPER